MDFIAHVRKDALGNWDKPQTLEEHLRGTADLAKQFAEEFDSADWAYALGLAHDTGKGTVEWQNYINTESGYNEEASSEAIGKKIEHSGSGAKLAEEVFGAAGRFLSYCIAGHHAGLADWSGQLSSLQNRLNKVSTENIAEQYQTMFRQFLPKSPPWKFERGLDVSLWIRMLFSCLIDADRLDTECYMDPDKNVKRQGYQTIIHLFESFNSYLTAKIQKLLETDMTEVNKVRQQVLADCRTAAQLKPGMFSLTVPTGGGKTLSSMAFALEHAIRYGQKRIIYVIPYTSIIEQNARVFRDIFGDDQILEHHANLDEEDSTIRSRLAAENWDAPIIVTTSVQFFESLFAAKTNRCRKLHNIANSVIVFDEVQLLPAEFLRPILETIHLLSKHYKASLVMCTATQPVFEKQKNFPEFPGLPSGSVREIVQEIDDLFARMKRVQIVPPNMEMPPVEWSALARELIKFEQALGIVSDRKSCRELYAQMPSGTYHLSALMCAQHRSKVIDEIKIKLRNGETVRVISTQLIEAGVDVDFPVVYRAMAGLDSIVQAAGRCNREGKLKTSCKVVVFIPPRRAPVGFLRKASETTQNVLSKSTVDLLDRNVLANYFSELYWKVNSLDAYDILGLLRPGNELEIRFREASKKFKIINDKNQRTILVPYGEGAAFIELLKDNKIPERKLLRKLQRYSVNIYINQFDDLQKRGSLKEVAPGIFALNNTVEYSEQVGLLIDDALENPEEFIG